MAINPLSPIAREVRTETEELGGGRTDEAGLALAIVVVPISIVAMAAIAMEMGMTMPNGGEEHR